MGGDGKRTRTIGMAVRARTFGERVPGLLGAARATGPHVAGKVCTCLMWMMDLCCGTVSALFALLDLDVHRGAVSYKNNSGNIAYTSVRGTRTVSDRQWEHSLVLGPRVSRRRAHLRFVIPYLPCHHPLGQTA